MRTLVALLIGHIVLLTLASTDFSIVGWVSGHGPVTWDYMTYAYRNGWGYDYVGNYGLGQVVCYILAYGLGAAAFSIAWFSYHLRASALAMILCLVGALSFCIELTHWAWAHHLSWIASFPAVLMVLYLFIGLQLTRIGCQARKSAT